MKTTGARARVLYILLAAFCLGVVYLVFSIFVNGGDWIAMPYNGHIYDSETDVPTGDITDRNGVLLAYSAGGNRKYSDNETVRTALLHTVGDSSGYIGTSVQASLGARLVGYNFFTGLNPLPSDTVFQSKDVELTVDSKLCAKAYELIGNKNAAVVISNYKTGEILCKVSTPTYDPMNVPSDLYENPYYNGVFLDNTLSTSYVPGSTFKLIVAACAIENMEDVDNLYYECNEEFHVGDSTVTCMGHHGTIGMQEALGHSCNIYFAKLAMDLGAEKLQKTAEKMGFNKNFGFSEFSTSASNIELNGAGDIDLAWAGVGQHTTSLNPTHAVLIMQAIANGGVSKALRLTDGTVFDSEYNTDIELMEADTANKLKKYMAVTAQDYYDSSLFDAMDICAKTGTGEVQGEEDTAWIVGFSQNVETPYAFAVVVKDAGFGYSVSGNIIIELLQML